MRRSLFLAATLALLCYGTLAHADLIPVPTAEWSYDVEPGADAVFADAPHTGSGVSFTNEQPRDVLGLSDVVLTNLRTFSLTPATDPALLDTSGAYTFDLTITDQASGQSTTRQITGKLGGSFSGDNSNVTNVFDGPDTYTVPLGDFVYVVTLGTYSPPGPPSATNAGSITAHIDVFRDDVTVAQAPEPSAMMLSCLGLSFLGGAVWRRRRARA
jgi:hypothetical protein